MLKESDWIKDLVDSMEELRRRRFWGDVTLVWQDGEVILARKDETFKAKDFLLIGQK